MENKIIDVLMNGSAVDLIAFTILIVLSIVYRKLISVYSELLYTRLKSIINKKKNANKIKELQYHNMFQVIEKVRSQVKHQKFYCCNHELDITKSQMFVDFMNFKLDAVKKSFHILIDKAVESKDNDMLKNQVMDCITDSISIYTQEAEIHFVKHGVPYNDAVYTVELFEKWRLDTVSSVGEQINSVFASRFHNTKFENLLAVLEIISIAIALIPKDGVAAFNSMNGKFKDIKYK